MDGVLYACSPSYGAGHKLSKKVFWSQSIRPDGPYAGVNSIFDDYGSSLLPDAFNVHWKTALNQQLAGVPISRFLMLHDDIVPEQFWMDKLLAELDETGADLISVVVPIKDSRALSSTALDDPDDPWEVYRRLTMHEVGQLPETFTAGDCWQKFPESEIRGVSDFHGMKDVPWGQMRPLLLNTGCWACRFDRPWRHKVHFEINTRIAFVTDRGKIIPNTDYREGMKGQFTNQVMPEDWLFSRQLNALGCDIRATRKIKLSHMGDAPFPNYDCSWGKWQTDEALRRKWDPDPLADVDGWLEPWEGRLLAQLAKGKDVLEIGAYCGKATIWMAREAKSVFAVDTFDGRGTPEPRNTLAECQANMKKHGVQNKVMVIQGESKNIQLQPGTTSGTIFDLAFIDGAHDRSSVEADVAACLSRLKPGGLIALHDYHSAKDPDVTGVVDELIEGGFKVEAQAGMVVALRVPTVSNGRATCSGKLQKVEM